MSSVCWIVQTYVSIFFTLGMINGSKVRRLTKTFFAQKTAKKKTEIKGYFIILEEFTVLHYFLLNSALSNATSANGVTYTVALQLYATCI